MDFFIFNDVLNIYYSGRGHCASAVPLLELCVAADSDHLKAHLLLADCLSTQTSQDETNQENKTMR